MTGVQTCALPIYLGQVVERTDVFTLFRDPKHPYTRALLASIPRLEDTTRSRLNTIPGNVPVPIDLPVQCPFCGRCGQMQEGLCDCRRPQLTELESGHYVSCFLYQEGNDDGG